MSFTVAALILAGLQAGAQFLKENKDVLKIAAPVVTDNIKRDYNRKQYEYSKWIKTETGLISKFLLSKNKNINDVAVVVKDYFDTYNGTKVLMRQIGNSYMVSCETTSNLSKAAGYHIKCNVIISKSDNYVEVEYQQLVNESILKAVCWDNAISGTGKLICAMDKKEIPIELHKIITNCLDVSD